MESVEGRPSWGEQMCKAFNISSHHCVSILSSNQPVEMVFKITDIVLCWVFWVSGCQMYAEAGGGGGGEGQGERKVPRVPVNMRRN